MLIYYHDAKQKERCNSGTIEIISPMIPEFLTKYLIMYYKKYLLVNNKPATSVVKHMICVLRDTKEEVSI